MNKQYYLILLLLTYKISFAQNLVSNPSFEDTLMCPNNISGIGDDQVSRAVGWSTFRETPDYFNSCSSTINVCSVPNNLPGYQFAHSGNAYCGILGPEITSLNYREFIGCQLLSSLVIGQKYYLSFFINWAGKPGFTVACNRLGALLSNLSYDYNNPAPINNFSTFHADSVYSDSLSWVQLRTSFIADSSYSYLIIGNFYDDAHTDTMNFGSFPFRAYYFIDDVCLSTDSVACIGNVGVIEPTTATTLNFFSNPFNNEINISVGRNEFLEFILYDITSRKLLQQKFTRSISLSTEQLAKGTYLYIVTNKSGVIKKGKIVKD